MLVIIDQHNGSVHRALSRHGQNQIAFVDPESSHAVIRRQIQKNLIRVGSFDPSVFHRDQLVSDRLHHGIHDRHSFQNALKRVQPYAAGHSLILFLRAGDQLGFLLFRGRRGRHLRLYLNQIDSRRDIIQREFRFVLLFQTDRFQDSSGLIVRYDSGSGFHSLQIAFADAAFSGNLLRRHFLPDAFCPD